MQKEKNEEYEDDSTQNLEGDNDEDSEVTGGVVEEGEVSTEEDFDETPEKK